MAQAFLQSSEQCLSHIDAEIKRLRHLRGQAAEAIEGDRDLSPSKATSKGQNANGRKGMNAEVRLRVAEAQKARWAKQKKTAQAVVSKPANKVLAKKTAAKKVVANKAAPEAPPNPAA